MLLIVNIREQQRSSKKIAFMFVFDNIDSSGVNRLVNVHLYYIERDITSRWVHRESNLMFTLIRDKDKRIIFSLSFQCKGTLRLIFLVRKPKRSIQQLKSMLPAR